MQLVLQPLALLSLGCPLVAAKGVVTSSIAYFRRSRTYQVLVGENVKDRNPEGGKQTFIMILHSGISNLNHHQRQEKVG